jgi:hypothetical protein
MFIDWNIRCILPNPLTINLREYPIVEDDQKPAQVIDGYVSVKLGEFFV